MGKNAANKVCISMVTYSRSADQNFEHDVDFLNRLSKKHHVSLIVERGGERPEVSVDKIYVQKAGGKLSRVLEHLSIVFRLRLSGTKVFYCRNSLMNANIAGIVTRLMGGRSYIWSCGELDKGRAATRREKGWIAYVVERAAYGGAFKLVSGLVTGTPTLKTYYANNLGVPERKITVLPNWVDLSRFAASEDSLAKARESLNLPVDCQVIIFPRSISERHGTAYLPEVVAKLADKGLKVVLVATGRGALASTLEEAFRQSGMLDRLRILHGVPNVEMPAYFALSNVTILPSLTEGFPRVILESMALGKPFVAFDVGGIRDVISEVQKDYLVPVGDTEAFSNKIAELMTNPERNERMVQEGNGWVKKFDVNPVVGCFSELFSEGKVRDGA